MDITGGPQLPPSAVAFIDAIAAYPGVTLPPDIRIALAALHGHGFDQAAVEEFTRLMDTEALPAGHGENHIGNDGRVVSACAPGECITCHGHATADGTWHVAGAA